MMLYGHLLCLNGRGLSPAVDCDKLMMTGIPTNIITAKVWEDGLLEVK